MTNKKPNDVRVVTVELLEITTSFIESHAEAFAKLNHGKRSEAFDTLSTELRAILAQPADQHIPFPGYPPVPDDRKLPADQQGEPAAWANGEHLLLCSRSRLDIAHSNPIYHELPRNIAGSALKTEYCDTPLYRHAQPATVKVALPGRETLKDVMAAVIGGDAYDCTRVWSAWGVGTMTDDDFVPIVEQEERLYELVDACLDEVARLNTPQ